MEILFHAHSGLRYLVLAAGVAAIAVLLAGWVGRRPFGRVGRIGTAVFVGLLDLQIVLGLVLWLGGRGGAEIVGHLVPMLLAAAVVHVASVLNQRRTEPRHGLPLAGVTLALTLILGGILAIRDTLP